LEVKTQILLGKKIKIKKERNKGLAVLTSNLRPLAADRLLKPIRKTEVEKTETSVLLDGFRPANREILASLDWQPRPQCLRAGLPCRGWAAKVPDYHPAWKLWRLNRAVMEQRGYRAAKDSKGDWYLEFWTADEEAALQFREQSGRVSSDLEVPTPEGLVYFPFQRAGVEFLASRSAALLADEMGTGKTIQIAGLLNLLRPRKVLIVVSASMKIIWALELRKWLVDTQIPIMILKGQTKPLDLPHDGIWIVNYELLGRFRPEIVSEPLDLMVLDEAHYIKTRTSARTKLAHLFSRCAKRKILLTGTPLLARPAELWSLLHFLAPADWPNFYRFAHRYCAPVRTEWGTDYSGASNLEELNARLRSRLMMRRLKADVLAQLPPLTRALVPLSISGNQALNEAVESAGYDPFNLPPGLSGSDIPFDCIARIRHELGQLKVKPAIEFIREQTEGYESKLVIFAHHRIVLTQIAAALPGAVLVTGETPLADRTAAIERFSNDPSTRFFVASIHAMGVGVTLSAASQAIFVEQDWTPGILRQAEDRLHRIGQQQSVLIQYLVVPDSIDVNIMRTVIAKMEVIGRTIE
jgi:SWI/SNF-related matrix-associated actin-dependent regulator 1 of chromatin subfamily A